MIKNISIFAPEIQNHYNKFLLSTPMPNFGDSKELLRKMFDYIVWKIAHKQYSSRKLQMCEEIKKEIREVYERIEEKLFKKTLLLYYVV